MLRFEDLQRLSEDKTMFIPPKYKDILLYVIAVNKTPREQFKIMPGRKLYRNITDQEIIDREHWATRFIGLDPDKYLDIRLMSRLTCPYEPEDIFEMCRNANSDPDIIYHLQHENGPVDTSGKYF